MSQYSKMAQLTH